MRYLKLGIVIVLFIILNSCPTKDHDPYSIKIFFDKMGVIGNGKDKIYIGCDVYNKDDEIIYDHSPLIFIEGKIFSKGYFSTNNPGYYTVTAEYRELRDSKTLAAFTPENTDIDSTLPDIDSIDVDLRRQQTQVWCWAACTEMVLDYYGKNYSQEQIVTYVFGYPYITTANDQQLITALNGLGQMSVSVQYYPLAFNSVKNIINDGMPIIAAYQGSFNGHVVVFYGYDNKGNIYIHDPYFGTFIVPYSLTYSYNQGAMTWNRSFLNLKPSHNQMRGRKTSDLFVQNDESATILKIDIKETKILQK